LFNFEYISKILKNSWVCVMLLCCKNLYQWIFFTFNICHQFHNFCYAGSFCLRQSSSSLFSVFAIAWCCLWLDSVLLVFLTSFCIYSWCQLIIPKLYLSTGTDNVPFACIFYAELCFQNQS
jgi:hypothetical protein